MNKRVVNWTRNAMLVTGMAGLLAACGPNANSSAPGSGKPDATSATPTPTAPTYSTTTASAASASSGVGGVTTRPTVTPHPPIPTAAAGVLHLGRDDSGDTVTVALGTTIDIALPSSANAHWRAVSADGNGNLREVSSSTSGGGGADAVYTASAPGQTALRSELIPNCAPCGAPDDPWSVTVVVQ